MAKGMAQSGACRSASWGSVSRSWAGHGRGVWNPAVETQTYKTARQRNPARNPVCRTGTRAHQRIRAHYSRRRQALSTSPRRPHASLLCQQPPYQPPRRALAEPLQVLGREALDAKHRFHAPPHARQQPPRQQVQLRRRQRLVIRQPLGPRAAGAAGRGVGAAVGAGAAGRGAAQERLGPDIQERLLPRGPLLLRGFGVGSINWLLSSSEQHRSAVLMGVGPTVHPRAAVCGAHSQQTGPATKPPHPERRALLGCRRPLHLGVNHKRRLAL